MGDVYFSERAYNNAGEWFAKAIKLDPDKETAYRYWGDALAASGKNDAAREKYINAVIAQPYTRPPWTALRQWSDRLNQQFNAILLQNKSSAATATDKAVNLDEHSLKSDNPETAGWDAYNNTRKSMAAGQISKGIPPRIHLPSQFERGGGSVGCHGLGARSRRRLAEKGREPRPSLLALIRVDHEGLLEPFVLLNRADPQIAQDYPAYRAAHRDKLYRYMDEFVLPKSGTQPSK